jgi:hypothetical protein
MLSPQITFALVQARIDDLHRERVGYAAAERSRARPAGTVRSPRTRIRLRALRASRA